MDKQVLAFLEWAKKSKETRLPSFEELPRVPLYMEQVVGYINEILEPITGKEKTLTPFMVNNYVKAAIMKEPDGKKYHEEHLGYLMFICLLKDSLSMDEIATLIALDEGISKDKSKLYRFFFDMSREISDNVYGRTIARVEDFHGRYKKNNKWPYLRTAEKDLRDSMGLVALRLAVTASINQRLARKLFEAIEDDLYGPEGSKVAKSPTKKEEVRANKIIARQAERMAEAKKLGEDKRKKEAEAKKKAKKVAKEEKGK